MPPTVTDEDLDDDELDEQPTDSQLVKDLRRQLKDTKREARENKGAATELQQLKRDQMLASEDFAGLTGRQRKALIREHEEGGGEFTADALKQTAVDLGFPVHDENAEIDAELDQHDRAAKAAQTGKTARTTGVLTPADVDSWAPDKWMRFEKEHPDAAEELLQGREVRGIAF